MNVGLVLASVSSLSGGLLPISQSLARALVRRGVAVEVVGLEDTRTAADLESWAPLRPSAFTTVGPGALGLSPGLAWHLARRFRGDLVHSLGLWMFPNLASDAWSSRTRRPHVVSPQGMLDPWALRNSRWKKRLAAAAFQDRALARASCLHALTRSEADAFRAYGLRVPVCVVPNGVDLPELGPLADRPPWPGEVATGRVLLFLGRLHPKKGLVELLHALAEVRRRAPGALEGWTLVVAGWDQVQHEAQLRGLVGELGLRPHVHFQGPLFGPEKEAAFRGADAFVLPSHSEGMPMAVLEAWAHALPVLLTPNCNLPEGRAAGAALSRPPEPRELAHGLEELLTQSPADARTMGTRGRRLVEQTFSWERVAKDLAAVYGWLLGGGATPACVEAASGPTFVSGPRR